MAKIPDFNDIFEKKTRINYSALDSKGQIKIISILNFFQDTASRHASEMGISGFELAKQNFAWVITQYKIKIIKTLKWNDEIIIRTWRIPCRNLYELRYFNIQDNNGTDIINATGVWVMVKKENSRPVRLSRFIPDDLLSKNRIHTASSSFDNSDNDSETQIHNLNRKLKTPDKINCQIPFKVRMQDLDLNQHVNNAVYLEWAVETMPNNFTGLYRPEQIDVTFHMPAFYGDTILSNTEIPRTSNTQKTLHSIVRKKENKPDKFDELARINITWTSI